MRHEIPRERSNRLQRRSGNGGGGDMATVNCMTSVCEVGVSSFVVYHSYAGGAHSSDRLLEVKFERSMRRRTKSRQNGLQTIIGYRRYWRVSGRWQVSRCRSRANIASLPSPLETPETMLTRLRAMFWNRIISSNNIIVVNLFNILATSLSRNLAYREIVDKLFYVRNR